MVTSALRADVFLACDENMRPPVQKEVILLIGYTGGLQCSKIVSLDFNRDDRNTTGDRQSDKHEPRLTKAAGL